MSGHDALFSMALCISRNVTDWLSVIYLTGLYRLVNKQLTVKENGNEKNVCNTRSSEI